MKATALREVRFFRPYPDEVPWDLLREAGGCGAGAEADLTDTVTRVAKRDGEVVAIYVLIRRDPTRFELLNLAVEHDCRGQGLGRWSLGHALGLAESKGARAVDVTPTPATHPFFEHLGFRPTDTDSRLTLHLTPE